MTRRPVIGLTLDIERPETTPEGEARRRLPTYALRENYCAAVVRAGGVPVLLPHETELAEAALGDGFGALPPIGGGPDAADGGGAPVRDLAYAADEVRMPLRVGVRDISVMLGEFLDALPAHVLHGPFETFFTQLRNTV